MLSHCNSPVLAQESPFLTVPFRALAVVRLGAMPLCRMLILSIDWIARACPFVDMLRLLLSTTLILCPSHTELIDCCFSSATLNAPQCNQSFNIIMAHISDLVYWSGRGTVPSGTEYLARLVERVPKSTHDHQLGQFRGAVSQVLAVRCSALPKQPLQSQSHRIVHCGTGREGKGGNERKGKASGTSAL